jgi:hypothetical protein
MITMPINPSYHDCALIIGKQAKIKKGRRFIACLSGDTKEILYVLFLT